MLPLSVAIIAKDEAANLPRLLDSLAPLGPSEIVVVDSGSQDETVAIARSYGAKVIETDWPGHVEQKNRALDACSQPWVLSLDADEPISKRLACNIVQLFDTYGNNLPYRGYKINRRNWFLGDWLYYVWTPEWRLRLIRRGSGQWVGDNPHDRLEIDLPVGNLHGDIHHFSHNSVEDLFERTVKYSRISSESLYRRGKRFKWNKIIFSPIIRFVKIIIIKQGWRDGWRGWIIAWASMLSGFLKYAFLYEMSRNLKTAANESKEAQKDR